MTISRREALTRSFAVIVGLGRARPGFLSVSGIELAAPGLRPAGPDTAAVAASAEPASASQVREFTLTVSRVRWEVAPGEVLEAYAYNGQVPGPELRVQEGDTVRVRVTNTLAEPTTVHWHGVSVSQHMDGVPGLSHEPIAPGESFTYEFVATPAGTRWYHPHINELAQTGGGLAAPLIIQPREPTSTASREYVVMAQQWTRPGRPMTGGHEADETDRFTVNGKAYPSSSPLVVRQGERVKLRLINAGTTATQVFALAGHPLTVTHTDGNPLRVPVFTDAVPLGVGERADVEFLANTPGRWQLGSVASGQAQRGLAVDVVYEGHEADRVQVPALADLQLVGYSAMTSGPLPTAKPDREFELVLSQSRTDPAVWTINDATYPATEPLVVSPGERIRVRLINMSMDDHPMHLHGHTYQIVAIGDRPVAGPFMDNLTLRHMDSYDIEFVAANAGRWLFHCHNLEHMMGGLMTEVHYR